MRPEQFKKNRVLRLALASLGQLVAGTVFFSLFHDVKDQFNSGRDAQFVINAEQIIAHRVLRDAKPLCNFFVRQRQRRSPVCTGMPHVQPHGSSLPGIGAVHGIEDVDAEGSLTTSRGSDPPELQVQCGDSSSS
jgi:hypothetical protein